MCFECVELAHDESSAVSADIFDVVGLVGFPQQQRAGPVRGQVLLAIEVRVACRDDALASEQPGVAMVGVQAVALPRVVTEHDIGAKLAYHPGDLAASLQVAVELTVDVIEEAHFAGIDTAQPTGRLDLFELTLGNEGGHIGVGVPGALRTIGTDQVMHDAAGRGPLGQRCATTELDVVGVGADGQRDGGHGEVVGEGVAPYRGLAWFVCSHEGSTSWTSGWSRSAGLSMSAASNGSRRTRKACPEAMAEAR